MSWSLCCRSRSENSSTSSFYSSKQSLPSQSATSINSFALCCVNACFIHLMFRMHKTSTHMPCKWGCATANATSSPTYLNTLALFVCRIMHLQHNVSLWGQDQYDFACSMLIAALKENISFRFSEFTQRLLQIASKFIFEHLQVCSIVLLKAQLDSSWFRAMCERCKKGTRQASPSSVSHH